MLQIYVRNNTTYTAQTFTIDYLTMITDFIVSAPLLKPLHPCLAATVSPVRGDII